MTERRGFFGRLKALIQGMMTSWIKDREARSPGAVYEKAITDRTRQYGELKRAVAGVLYMRNKIEGEIAERRGELARLHDDITRAVRRNDDEVALAFITQKEALVKDLERAEAELDEIHRECEGAKGNLVKFRGEIRSLEREKVRMMAALANAKARRRIQAAFDSLNVEGDMKALESVRQQIAQLKVENRIDSELGGDPLLEKRIREIREEAVNEGARLELAELKRRLQPQAIPANGDHPTVEVTPEGAPIVVGH